MATNKTVTITAAMKASGFKEHGADVGNLSKGYNRLANQSTATGRAFAAQSKGLGGLVAAYAGAAATIFALQQAFSALNQAAKNEQLIQGTRTLASAVGESGDKILSTINKVTKAQISMAAAAEQTNAALAAGFSGDQIEQLASIASKASKALGRDLTDAFSRLVRGAGKLEPELLDELGIFTRLEHSVGVYASQLGKSATSLTQFERRQAFVNSVIEEGNRKFTSISISEASAAQNLAKLVTTLANLGQTIGVFIANALNPLVVFFNDNLFNSIALFGILAKTVFGKAVSVMQAGASGLSKSLEESNIKIAKFFTSTKQLKELVEVQKAAEAISLNTVGGKANAPLKAAIVAARDGATFAEALALKQAAEERIAKNKARLDVIATSLANPNSKMGQAGKDKLVVEQTNRTTQNKLLNDTVTSTNAAIQSQSLVAKGLQNTLTKISTAFSFLLNLGSKVLFWAGLAITAFSLLQLVLDKFGISDTFDAILSTLGKGVANFFGFTEAAKKADESITSLSQSIFNMQTATEKLDITKGTGVKSQSWLAKWLGLDPESIKFTEELAGKELQKLTNKFKEIADQRKDAINNEENLFNDNMRSATGRSGADATDEYKAPFLEQKDRNIMDIDLKSIAARAEAVQKLRQDYVELNGAGEKTIHFIIKAAEETQRLSENGPDALADLKTAADETGIAFEKLYKSFSIEDNKLTSTSSFLPDFTPNITSYKEFNDLRQKGARQEILRRQQINEQEFAFIRLQNVAIDLKADLLSGLASEEALSTKIGALKNIELEILKQIKDLAPTVYDENTIQNYFDEIKVLQDRLNIFYRTSKEIRAQADLQILISQKTDQLKKSFSEELNLASQINGVLNAQSVIAKSSEEIRANELVQLDIILTNTKGVRDEAKAGVTLTGEKVKLNAQGIAAEQILLGLAIKVSQAQKKILDDLKKQNIENVNKVKAARLQQQLTVLQDQQKLTDLLYAADAERLQAKEAQLAVDLKINEILIRAAHLTKQIKLDLLSGLASGPLDNLFSDTDRKNIQISIAEHDLNEFKSITNNQLEAAVRRANTAQEQLIQDESREKARYESQLEIIDIEKAIVQDKIRADKASTDVDREILKIKIDLLAQEASFLAAHIAGLGAVFAEDIIQRKAIVATQNKLLEQGPQSPEELAKFFKDTLNTERAAAKVEGNTAASAAAAEFEETQYEISKLYKSIGGLTTTFYKEELANAEKNAEAKKEIEYRTTSNINANIARKRQQIEDDLDAEKKAAESEIRIREAKLALMKKMAEYEGDLFALSVNLLFGKLKEAIKNTSDELGKALTSGNGIGKALLSFGDNLRTAFVDSASGALSLTIQKKLEKNVLEPIQDEFLAAFGLNKNDTKPVLERIADNTKEIADKIPGQTGKAAKTALSPTVKGLTSLAFGASVFFDNKIKEQSEAVTKAQEREGIAKEQLTKITESHKTAIQNEKTALDAVRNSVKARTNAEKDLQKTIGSGITGYSEAVDTFISSAKELERNDNVYSQAANRTVQLGIIKQAQEDIVKSAIEERIKAEKQLAATQKISSIAISTLTIAISHFSSSTQTAARNIVAAGNAVSGAGAGSGAAGGIVSALTGGFKDASSFLSSIGQSILSEIGKKLFNFDGLISGIAGSISGLTAAIAAESAAAIAGIGGLAGEAILAANVATAAATAATIATIIPYIGLVIGALALFGAFKKKPSVGPNANASAKLVNGEYVRTDSGSDNGGDRSAAHKLSEATGKTLKNIQDIFSIGYTNGESPQFRVGYLQNKFFGGVTDPTGGGAHQDRLGFAEAEDAVAYAIAATLKQAADKGTLRASKDITDAIKHLDLSEAKEFTAEKFSEVLEFSANFSNLLDKLNNVALTAANYAGFAAKSASARVRGVFSEISDILTKTAEIFGNTSSQYIAAQRATQNYLLQTLGLQKNGSAFEAFKRNEDTVGAYQFRIAEVESTFTTGSDANNAYREGLKKTGLTDAQINNILSQENKEKVIRQLGIEFSEAVTNGLNPGKEAAVAFAKDTARYLLDAKALFDKGAITQAEYDNAKILAQQRYNEIVSATQKEIDDLTRKLQDAKIATNQAKIDLRDFAINLKNKVIPDLQEGLKQARNAIKDFALDLVGQFQSATDKLYGIFDSTTKNLEEATQARKDVEAKYGVDSTRDIAAEIAAKQRRLQELSTELAGGGGLDVNTLSGFIAYSRKAAELRQLSVDVPKLTAAKKEIDAARNKEAQITGDLAFVTKELSDTGLDLVTQRYSESEIVKNTRKAVEEFTKAQKELGAAIYEIATNPATTNLIDINKALLDTNNKVYKVNAGFGTFITRADGMYDELQKGATANTALAAIFKVSTDRGNVLKTVLEGVTVSTLEAYTVLQNGLKPAFVDIGNSAEILRRKLDQPREGLSDSFKNLKELIDGPSGLIQQTEDLGNAQAALILTNAELKGTIDDLIIGARDVNPYIEDLRSKLNGVRDAISAENGVTNELQTAKNKLLELALAVTTLPGDLGIALRAAIEAATNPDYFVNQFRIIAQQFSRLSADDRSKYRNVSGGDPYYSQATDEGIQRVGAIVRSRDNLIGRISDANQIKTILSDQYGDTVSNRSNQDLGAVALRSRYAQLTGSNLANIGAFATLASGDVTSTSAAISRGARPVSDYNDLITRRDTILRGYSDEELGVVDRAYYGGSLYGTTGTNVDKRNTFFSNLSSRDTTDKRDLQTAYDNATSGDISQFASIASQAGAAGLTAAGYSSLVTQRNSLLNRYNPTQLRGVYNTYYARSLPGVDPTDKTGFINALGVQDTITLQNLNSRPAGYNPNYGFPEFQDIVNQFTTLGIAGSNIYSSNPRATGQEAMWYSTNDYTTRRVGEIIRNRNNILGNITSMGQLQNIIQTYGYASSSDPGAEIARNRLGFLQSNYPAAYASGGSVMRRDSVNAMLEPGEFVMRKHAVNQIGRDNLTEINSTGRVNSGNVEINIVNNGTAQEVEGVPVTRRDGDKLIVDVILRDLRNNGPISRKIKTGAR